MIIRLQENVIKYDVMFSFFPCYLLVVYPLSPHLLCLIDLLYYIYRNALIHTYTAYICTYIHIYVHIDTYRCIHIYLWTAQYRENRSSESYSDWRVLPCSRLASMLAISSPAIGALWGATTTPSFWNYIYLKDIWMNVRVALCDQAFMSLKRFENSEPWKCMKAEARCWPLWWEPLECIPLLNLGHEVTEQMAPNAIYTRRFIVHSYGWCARKVLPHFLFNTLC